MGSHGLMSSITKRAIVTFIAVVFATAAAPGCATSARPLPVEKRVALTPPKNDVAVVARAGQPVGEVIPVDVSIANGTDEPYLIDPSQIFAVDDQGQKILPVPPAEAIREAGDANSLKAALTGAAKNAAVGAIAGAAIGAALGVAIAALLRSTRPGRAYGAAMGGGYGAAMGGVAGGVQGQAAAHLDAAAQINALCLQQGAAHPNYSVNGYVFFPKGTYRGIQINLLNEESHQTRTITAGWNDAGASTVGQAAETSEESSFQGNRVPAPQPGAVIQPGQSQITE